MTMLQILQYKHWPSGNPQIPIDFEFAILPELIHLKRVMLGEIVNWNWIRLYQSILPKVSLWEWKFSGK